jgi:hypothetical protein
VKLAEGVFVSRPQFSYSRQKEHCQRNIMLTQIPQWSNIENSGIDELLLELISNDENMQKIAYEALQYNLLNLGADREENYGAPQLLLTNDLHLNVIPLLVAIAEDLSFNVLSRYLALYLLWDFYNFASQIHVKKYNEQKAESIRQAIKSYTPTYRKISTHETADVQKRAQALLRLIEPIPYWDHEV